MMFSSIVKLFQFRGDWYRVRLTWDWTTVRARIVDAYGRPANRVELVADIGLMRDMWDRLLDDFVRETIERNDALCWDEIPV